MSARLSIILEHKRSKVTGHRQSSDGYQAETGTGAREMGRAYLEGRQSALA